VAFGTSKKFLLSYRNFADDGVYSDMNISPSDWTDSLPLSNLQNRQLTSVARSTVTDADYIVDLGRNRSITFFALLRHNLTTNGKWRVRTSRVSDFSVLQSDSGLINIWPNTQIFGSLPWGSFTWNGRQLTNDANDGIILLDTAAYARYIWVRLLDPSNDLGYLQAGRFIVDAPWRPNYSVQFEWGVKWSNRSVKTRSRGGQIWGDSLTEFRTLTFDLAGMTENEAFSQAYEVDRTKGLLGDVYASIDPTNTSNRHKYSIYGTQSAMFNTTQRTHRNFVHPFSVEESL